MRSGRRAGAPCLARTPTGFAPCATAAEPPSRPRLSSAVASRGDVHGWDSFDTIGRDCLEAASAAGAEIVGVVTLPGPIDPHPSGQCSFDEVAARRDAVLHETRASTRTRRSPRSGSSSRSWFSSSAGRSSRGIRSSSSRARVSSECIRRCFHAIEGARRFPGRSSPGSTHRRDVVRDRRRHGGFGGDRGTARGRDLTGRNGYDALRAHCRSARRAVRELVPQLIARTASRIPQDPSRASSWPKRSPRDESSIGRPARRTCTTGCARRRVPIPAHSRSLETRR